MQRLDTTVGVHKVAYEWKYFQDGAHHCWVVTGCVQERWHMTLGVTTVCIHTPPLQLRISEYYRTIFCSFPTTQMVSLTVKIY